MMITERYSQLKRPRFLKPRTFIGYLCLLFLFTTCKKEIAKEEISYSGIKYLEGGNTDKVNKIEKTADGGFIYCGYTGGDTTNADAFMMKVDAGGNKQWYKTYGGHYYDEFKHAIQCSDGGYIAVGHTNSYGKGFKDKTYTLEDYIVKTDANGNEQWVKSYIPTEAQLNHVMETPNHQFIAVGNSRDYVRNIAYLKLEANGKLIKYKTFLDLDTRPVIRAKGTWNEFSNFVTLANDGHIIIGGVMDQSNRIIEVQHHVTYIAKVDIVNDTFLFFNDYQDFAREINFWFFIKPYRLATVKIINLADGYYIGTHLEVPGSRMIIQLIKTDLEGKIQWEKKYNGLGSAMIYDMQLNTDQTIIMTGSSSADPINLDFQEGFGNMKTLFIKVDKNGNEIWTKYPGSDKNTSIAKCVKPKADGGWNAAGLTSISKGGIDKMFTLSINKIGQIDIPK